MTTQHYNRQQHIYESGLRLIYSSMKFNVKKSKEMIFHSKKCAKDFLLIIIDNDVIDRIILLGYIIMPEPT